MPRPQVIEGEEIGLYELINCVKKEIKKASDDAQARNDSMFSLRELELELNVGITKAGEGGVNLFIFTLGAKVNKENSSRVKIVMEPRWIKMETTEDEVRNLAHPDGRGLPTTGGRPFDGLKPDEIPLHKVYGIDLFKNDLKMQRDAEALAKKAEVNGHFDLARSLREGLSLHSTEITEKKNDPKITGEKAALRLSEGDKQMMSDIIDKIDWSDPLESEFMKMVKEKMYLHQLLQTSTLLERME
jgi:hypothetical protein